MEVSGLRGVLLKSARLKGQSSDATSCDHA